MGTVTNTLTHLLNEIAVAEMLGVSVASVRRWRLCKQGPRFLKLAAANPRSGAVRYRPEDIAAWLESRPTGGGHQETR